MFLLSLTVQSAPAVTAEVSSFFRHFGKAKETLLMNAGNDDDEDDEGSGDDDHNNDKSSNKY